MKKTDLAWAAGLFDGEGCVTTLWPKRWQARIEINMVHKPTLDRFVDIAGCGKVTLSYEKRKNHRRQWRWRVSDKNAVKVASLLREYSCEKFNQLSYLVNFKATTDFIERGLLAERIKKEKTLEF